METAHLLKTETDRIEWKQTEKDTKDIARAVCALANDLGDTHEDGYLVLGVRKDGTPAGIKGDQLDNIQQKLNSLLTSTQILPTPSCDISAREYDKKHIIAVCVQPYPTPPVVTVNQTAWVPPRAVQFW
uniref:DNA-binding domain-containing protein n=1 Tax=Candidatus Kentrum sp. LPFa TaxID=2126335 RepID=A0A450Y182_9GAMM|nr:MAG: Putative DNA-binding domain-containing protein [Candidatus Kentron sp. LPFa]VFK35301.1 MAG: Putative DNA-binding domain-containing protein [Candidatus Kentron sp. LPFa]